MSTPIRNQHRHPLARLSISPRNGLVLLMSALALAACGGGGSGGGAALAPPVAQQNPPPSEDAGAAMIRITGQAVKSEIDGATVRAFYVDEAGEQVELAAANAPVITAADGAYSLDLDPEALQALGDRPVIVETTGGRMGADGSAPPLRAVLADPASAEEAEGATLHLSFASTVAAGLVTRALAEDPATSAAQMLLARVEEELDIDLADNPADRSTDLAQLNQFVDDNLGLADDPLRNDLVGELAEYFVANLSSSSGKFDGMMESASSPGVDVPASFIDASTPGLSAAFGAGEDVFSLVRARTDKAAIENSGVDFAWVTVEVLDAENQPVADGTEVFFKLLSGQAILSYNTVETLGGEARINVTSIWPGDLLIEASSEGADDQMVTAQVAMTVVDEVPDVADTDKPRVVAAGAVSNTEILVVFSEAMRGGEDGANDPNRYTIAARPADTGVVGSAVAVLSKAELLPPEFTTVRITTFSQSEITYSVKVTDVKDVAGNTMEEPIPGVTPGIDDPSSGVYVGLAPTPADIKDTDGDGISDTDEQFGWSVTVVAGDGNLRTLYVSSDPRFADTDLDGIPDADERQAGIDPRSPDTDGDTLGDDLEWNNLYSSPIMIDSDGDGIEDGFEVGTFRTSPILADSDGDQLPDFDEVIAANRNPLEADLPTPRISVGNVSLLLDTRFTYTDTEGQTVEESSTAETTLVAGEDTTYSTSSERSTLSTLETSQSLQLGGGLAATDGKTVPTFNISGSVSSTQGSQRGSTFAVSQESARRSEETYQESLTTSAQVSAESSVVREVVGAALRVDVTIDNAGDIPFTIRNLELTALTQDPADRTRVIPVASLVPENPNLEDINIGALGDTSRGPFSFVAVDVFPAQVEELLKNPRGIVVQLSNYDIVDEDGRNFSFSSREVLDRTAGLTFDLGDGRVESYRVATGSSHNPNTGEPLGITLGYALNQILGFTGEPQIVDGGNGRMEVELLGDDIALVASGGIVEPGRAVVTPGENGILDSIAGGDDEIREADYATQEANLAASVREGGDGLVSTIPLPGSDDLAILPLGARVAGGQEVINAGPDGILQTTPSGDEFVQPAARPRQVLTRFRDTQSVAEEARFWGVFSTRDLLATDLEDIVLRAGEELIFTYVQDRDGDGVFAREEFLHGSSDLLFDTDDDLLSDKEEIQDGWRVMIKKTTEARQVYPNPLFEDSDRDALIDRLERDCLLDPRQFDTDLDGLSDYEELKGVRIVDGVEGPMVSRDLDGAVVYTISVYTGESSTLIDGSTQPLFPHVPLNEVDGQDLCSLDGVAGFATDPTDPDTDGDGIEDGRELALGIHPNFTEDGPLFLDDDGDGVPNLLETAGYTVNVNGTPTTFTSNPNQVDTDGDGLPDLLERYLGTDPRASDTDGDLIGDFDEYVVAGDACVTVVPGQVCESFRNRPTANYNEFLRDCDQADVCGYDEQAIAASSLQLGTNLSEADSDFDAIDDRTETLTMFTLTNNGGKEALPAPVSDPLLADTDGDSLRDDVELLTVDGDGDLISNPRVADTDGDGVNDDLDSTGGLQPNRRDRQVTIAWEGITLQASCDGNGDAAEFREGRFYTEFPTFPGSGTNAEVDVVNFFLLGEDDLSIAAGTNLIGYDGERSEVILGPSSSTFVVIEGERAYARARGLKERDASSGDDDIDNLDVAFDLRCSVEGCALEPADPPPTVLNTTGGDSPCFEVLVRAFPAL
ncbi:MAG: hypothetical protein AAF184_19395 [Pseudomonadota bacterium]